MLSSTLFARMSGLFLCLMLLLVGSVVAKEGQADLDAATEAKLGAETLADLEKVAALCESALKKGLDDEGTQFAKQLLGSVLLDHAERLSNAIFQQTPPDPRWQVIRKVALNDLKRAIAVDATLAKAHLLTIRLQALPGGDKAAARAAADAAAKLLSDDKPQLAEVLVLRGQLSDDAETQMADLNAALEADPKCAVALQARARLYLERDEQKKAVDDLLRLLEIDSKNLAVQGAVAETLASMEKFDEALKHVDRVIELNPRSPLGYRLRARIRILQDQAADAAADLEQALKLDPHDVMSLLMRAQVKTEAEQYDAAKADIDQALSIMPDLTQAILLRSMIAAQQKRFGEAIGDLKLLIQAEPKNIQLRLQLGAYYTADNRPRTAIKLFDELLESDPENWQIRRARADALLSVGRHADAIADYDVALKAEPDDSHMLNNLAWVLATTPDDTLRNGRRSLEVGLKACEVTKYEKPHILSTLAAGYAETGDWENAVKWSSKAVELNAKVDPEVSEQLGKELESYKQKKPWREKQDTPENNQPLDQPREEVET